MPTLLSDISGGVVPSQPSSIEGVLAQPDPLATSLAMPEPAPVLDAPVLAFPDAGNPLLDTFGASPWDTQDAAWDAELAKWRQNAQDRVDEVALNPEAYFKDADLGFAADPKRAQILATNDAFLGLANDGNPLPPGDIPRAMFRQQVAIERFQGRGGESEEAFHAEIVKEAQGRKAKRENFASLIETAGKSALVESAGESSQELSFAKWKESVAASPGYSKDEEADYYEAYSQAKIAAKSAYQEFSPQLSSVWKAVKGNGSVGATAWDAYDALPDAEDRQRFMASLHLLAKTLPKEEQATFWGNLRKQAGRDIGTTVENAAGLDLYDSFLQMGLAEDVSPQRVAQDDEERRRKDFAADVSSIQQTTYDPMKYLAPAGSWSQAFEKGAYAGPGAITSSAMAAIPVVGMPMFYATAYEGAYQNYRQQFEASGMSYEDARDKAETLAGPGAALEMVAERFAIKAFAGKLPFFEKAMASATARINSLPARFAARTAAGALEEGMIEKAQDLIYPSLQEIGQGLGMDVPDQQWINGKDGILDGFWKDSASMIVTMLPLAILGGGRGALKDSARVAAFRDASDQQLLALGMSPENVSSFRMAEKVGVGSASQALDAGVAALDPQSETAKTAVAKLEAEATATRRAQEDLEKLGYAAPSFVQHAEGLTVFDGEGQELGTSPDLSGALRIASAHTTALDNLEADQIAALGTLMEAAKAAVALDPSSTVDVNLGQFDPEKATPEMAARFAAQVALKEQAEGGTGDIARSVLGYSVTEMAQGVRHTVNRLFHGAAVTDVFHETFHGLRRQARAAGTITRTDELAMLRALDAVLAGKMTKDGVQLRFIPENMTDEQVSETLLDEAFSEIAEMEILRTRKGAGKGKLGLTRGVISRNLTALAKLIPGVAGKWTAFMAAVRARWGLSLSRAIALKKAERDGTFDKEGYDAYLDKILGLDAQAEHDAGVKSEFDRILGLPEDLAGDDIPFSIGNAKIPVDQFMAGSKVVDAKGAPIKVFHGSPDIRKILADGFAIPNHRQAIFFVDTQAVAETYADDRRAMDFQNAEPHVIPAFLSIKNPLEIDAKGQRWRETERHISEALQGGHDGIIIRNSRDEYNDTAGTGRMATVYAVFFPDQVKSASTGSFRSRVDGIDLGPAAFSIGPAQVAGILSDNALARITDPRRRTQVMSRIARDFNAMRLQIDRMASLSGIRRSKGDLRREAMAREDLRAEELIADVHRRFGEIMADEDLVKIKSQPVHAALADPSSPLRGRLKSKAAAIREHPDMFQLHRAGDYDGSDGVSRSVFGGQRMPDQAAQELYDAGLIPEPTADALWEALLSEQKTVAGMKELLQKATEQIREAKAQAKQEANEWLATQGKDQEVNFSDKEEIRRSLRMLDAILLALPPEIRGKIGGYTQISMIATDEARLAYLKDKLAKADKELETFLRVEYAKEWEALLAKAAPKTNEPGQRPTGSIAADAYDIFRIAETAMGMNFAAGEAEADKWDAIADHPDTDPKDVDMARVKAQMIRLTMNWTTADAARREQAVFEGEKVYYQGLQALKIEASRRRERLGKLRDSAVRGTGKTGHRMEREATKQADATNLGKVKAMRWEFLSFGQIVNVLFGEKSAAAQWFNSRELAASNAAFDGFQAKANGLESLFDTLSGNRFDGEKLRHRMATVKSITVQDAFGDTHTFTDAEAIDFLLTYRQEDGKRHMQGMMDDDGNIISEWAWDDKSAAAVESQLSKEGRAAMAFLGQSYGEEYGRINAVFRRIWNVSMPRHKLYAPISANPAQGKGDTIMDPESGDTMGVGMTPSSLKNRSFSAVAEIEFKDAFQKYLTHARQMEHFIAYGEFSRDALAIINRRETRNAIKAAGGAEAAATLSKWVDYFALGGVHGAAMGGAWASRLGGMLGRLSQAALVGRVSVLFMQSLQLAAASFKMPTGAFITRFAKLSAGRLQWGDALRSEYVQRRLAQMPPVVRDAMQGIASGTPNRAKYLAGKVAQTISGADALFTAGTYAIFYDYHLGLARKAKIQNPEAHAHAEAERLTDQVAQPTRTGARSWLEVANASNPAFRAAWNFSSDPRQKMSLLVYAAMRRDTTGLEKAGDVAFTAAKLWIIGGVLQTLLRTVLRDLRNDDDDEVFDERYWSPARLALQVVTGPLGAVPFLGGMMEDATYKLTGQYAPQGGMLSFLDQAASLPQKWSKGKVEPIKDLETLTTAGAGFSGTSAAAASAMHLIRDVVGFIENLEGPD